MENFSPFDTEHVLYQKFRNVKVGLETHEEWYMLTEENNAYMAWRKVFWNDPDSNERQQSTHIMWVEFLWPAAIERAIKEFCKIGE